MTPAQLVQQNRMEEKIDTLLTSVTRIDTYQKTHYQQLQAHQVSLDKKASANELEKIALRLARNEKIVTRAGGGLSAVVFLMGAYVTDFFKGGGS